MSEEDKPKSKAQKEEEQKLADDAADYIYTEVLGSGKADEEEVAEGAATEDVSTTSAVKNYVVETGNAIATSVSEAVSAGQEYIAGVNEGVSKEGNKKWVFCSYLV